MIDGAEVRELLAFIVTRKRTILAPLNPPAKPGFTSMGLAVHTQVFDTQAPLTPQSAFAEQTGLDGN